MKKKSKVVARMTVIRTNGMRTIIELEEGCTWSTFYKFYSQVGLKRSTKKLLRTANRNEGLSTISAVCQIPGLEAIERRWSIMPNIASTKIRVIKKRAYRRLLTASPDQLGMVRSSLQHPERLRIRFPVYGLMSKAGMA